MRKESFEFLKSLQETPSPSGFEQPVQRLVRDHMEQYADSVETDVHGNVIVALKPDAALRVMLAGHCDQIGLMVKYIDSNGFIFFSTIGGIDPGVLPGSRVVVHSSHGPIQGVIGRKAIHLMKQEERGGKVEIRDLWIDIGAKDKKEVDKVIRPGDPITFVLEMTKLGGDLVTSPAFDNKCGTFVVMEALRLCAARKIRCGLFAVSTVQEEIGLRGAQTASYRIDPQVGIAVDVTQATDYPDIDKRMAGEVKIGGGPTIYRGANVNANLADMLDDTAKAKRIPVQPEGFPGALPTDANPMQLSRAGVATAHIGIPNRYMHTQVEVISLADLERAARLIADTVAKIHNKTSFIPK